MKLVSRPYKPGDEVFINRLYKLVTSRDRNTEEYKWEWLETWDGKGNVYLLFDEERHADDRLICQYSLIPVPFSYLGRYVLAGKTENCMSHFDVRGKSVYIPHEKKYFEDAKKRFKIFFTTTANTGAAWAVRKKLGYFPLDSWASYYYYLDYQYLQRELDKQIQQKIGNLKFFSKLISIPLVISLRIYCSLNFTKSSGAPVKILSEGEINLDDIEKLWSKNKEIYGITVDRNAEYMHWRINKNPYHHHNFLCQYNDDTLVGYLIFYIDKKNIIRVVDTISDRKEKSIFINLFENLKKYAIEHRVNSISCSIMQSNHLLSRILRRQRFISDRIMSFKFLRSKREIIKDFYAFIADELQEEDSQKPGSWYITDLFKEGR